MSNSSMHEYEHHIVETIQTVQLKVKAVRNPINLHDYPFALQLSLSNQLKPGVKSRMMLSLITEVFR